MQRIFSIYIPRTNIGLGSANSVGDLAKEFGATNVLIISDAGVVAAGLVNRIQSSLEKAGCKFGLFDGCEPNAPVDVIEQCSQIVADGGFDLLIGIGGGSVMDTTKIVSAVAFSRKKVQDFFPPAVVEGKTLTKLLIPTTSGTGSEWSRVALAFDKVDGRKKLVRGQSLFADAAIVDPELTMGLPQKVTAETGMDALTHAIEAYVSPRSNVVGDMFAERTMKMVSDNLRLAYAKGSNKEARYNMSIAASMSMVAVGLQGAGLVHQTDGYIVTKANISHGEALSILLPHIMTFNILAVPKRLARIAELLGERIESISVIEAAEKSVEAVRKLSQDLGMRQTLGDVGIVASDIPHIVDDVFAYEGIMLKIDNPRSVSKEDLSKILNAAL